MDAPAHLDGVLDSAPDPEHSEAQDRSGAERNGSRTPRHRARRKPVARALGILWTLTALVAVVAGALALVVAIAVHLSRSGEYTVFGHPVLIVESGSMAPSIRTGDLAYDDPVSPAEADHLRVGEIITFHIRPGSFETITHRIHAVVTSNGAVAYQTKGDQNNAPDGQLVPPGQIVGVFRDRVPFGGYVLNALHRPVSLALLLVSPMLWLLSGWFFGLAREADPRNPDRSFAEGREEAPM